MKNTKVLAPVRTERMSAGKFAAAVAQNRTNIARSRFVPPTLGSRCFGSFEVEYKVPVLKPVVWSAS